MNPNDLLFLTIPAALLAFKLAILAIAALLVTRNIFKTPRRARVGTAAVAGKTTLRDSSA